MTREVDDTEEYRDPKEETKDKEQDTKLDHPRKPKDAAGIKEQEDPHHSPSPFFIQS